MGLFSSDKQAQEHGAVDTIIGAKARFKGTLVSSGAVNINGEFEGRIQAKGEVIIGRGSRVVGDVLGGNVVVSGRVDGNITADHTLEIARSGRVSGDLAGGRIIIEEGSTYRGRVKVNQGQETADQETVEIIEETSAQLV